MREQAGEDVEDAREIGWKGEWTTRRKTVSSCRTSHESESRFVLRLIGSVSISVVSRRLNWSVGLKAHQNWMSLVQYVWQAISKPSLYRVRLQIWTQEMEQSAQQAAQAGADHCALHSISCVQIWRRTRYNAFEMGPNVDMNLFLSEASGPLQYGGRLGYTWARFNDGFDGGESLHPFFKYIICKSVTI